MNLLSLDKRKISIDTREVYFPCPFVMSKYSTLTTHSFRDLEETPH